MLRIGIVLYLLSLLVVGFVSCNNRGEALPSTKQRVIQKPKPSDTSMSPSIMVIGDPLKSVSGELSPDDMGKLKRAKRDWDGSISADKEIQKAGLRVLKFVSFKGKTLRDVEELIGGSLTEKEVIDVLKKDFDIPKKQSVMIYTLDDGWRGYYIIFYFSNGRVERQRVISPLVH